MAQVSIYLDDETAARMEKAARAAGVSRSRWLADVVRSRLAATWPEDVRALAGAWPDAPTAEQIRTDAGADVPREVL